MAVQEYLCHECESTFVIRDNKMLETEVYVKCLRCKSSDIERYYFPRDACRLYNLVETNLTTSEQSLYS